MRLFVLIYLSLVLLNCSSDDIAGGGTELPNGIVEIACVDTLSNVVVGADVQLLGVIITPDGYSSFYESNLNTDQNGKCSFTNVPDGRFVMSINDKKTNTGSMVTRIEVKKNLWKSEKIIMLHKETTAKGRVVNWDKDNDISIIVPGIQKSFKPNENGFYTISGFLFGGFDICLVSGSVVNYLSLYSSGSNDNDTTYLRDVNYVSSISATSSLFNYYDQSMENSYQITPEHYEPHNEPAWYNGHDFTKVDYLVENDFGDPLTEWYFPVVVGISDSTLKHYGNDSVAFYNLVENQFDQINVGFNEADISGKIEFSLDSLYIITGDINSENILPPPGYSLKLIYDAFGEGTFGNWAADNNVASYSYSPNSEGGVFGEKGLTFLMWMLGLSRGCYYICESEVNSGNNSVSGTDFKQADFVMNNRSFNNWSSINSKLLNYNRNNFNCDRWAMFRRFPDTISLKIENGDSLPLSNVAIDIYTVSNHDHSVKDSIVYSGISDVNGEYYFTENPFIKDDKKGAKHDNLLIRTIYSEDTVFTWLPLFEVSDSCFIDSVMTFQKIIVR